jgi:hypothetical protein
MRMRKRFVSPLLFCGRCVVFIRACVYAFVSLLCPRVSSAASDTDTQIVYRLRDKGHRQTYRRRRCRFDALSEPTLIIGYGYIGIR